MNSGSGEEVEAARSKMCLQNSYIECKNEYTPGRYSRVQGSATSERRRNTCHSKCIAGT